MRVRVEREVGSLNKRWTIIYLTNHLQVVPWLQTRTMLPANGMTPSSVPPGQTPNSHQLPT